MWHIYAQSVFAVIKFLRLESVKAYKFDIDCAPIAMIIKYKGHAHKEKALRSKR